MLVVLDTNILISALLVQTSPPAKLIELWRNGRFTLLTAQPQYENRKLHRILGMERNTSASIKPRSTFSCCSNRLITSFKDPK